MAAWLQAARHPFGIILVLCSVALAALMLTLPQLTLWSPRAPLVLAAGIIGWAASAAVVSRWPIATAKPAPPPEVVPDPPAPLSRVESVPADFAELVEDALKRLDRIGTLAESPLLGRLPRILPAIRERLAATNPDKPPGDGQVLRTALVEAIDRLSVRESDAGNRSLQHQVLYMEYVERRTVVQMTIRLSISEQTLFRRRKEGVDAVARDLWRQEQRGDC